jgi:Flp pilus assembly CpaE family ATPase
MSEPSTYPQVLGMISARPEGATSLAIALAAVRSASTRTLLMDLNPERAEIASLLDVDDSQNVYHLAYRSQLGPLAPNEVEKQVRWHDGLAVLPGITDPAQGELLSERAVSHLLAAARPVYPRIVLDLGRARADLPALPENAVLLWVLAPTRLGLATFDRAFQRLKVAQAPWLERVQVVVNQVGNHSLSGVIEFLSSEHGIASMGSVPYESEFWLSLGLDGRLGALCSPFDDRIRYQRDFGQPALSTRTALEQIIQQVANCKTVSKREQAEVRGGTSTAGRSPRPSAPGRGSDSRRLRAHPR